MSPQVVFKTNVIPLRTVRDENVPYRGVCLSYANARKKGSLPFDSPFNKHCGNDVGNDRNDVWETTSDAKSAGVLVSREVST